MRFTRPATLFAATLAALALAASAGGCGPGRVSFLGVDSGTNPDASVTDSSVVGPADARGDYSVADVASRPDVADAGPTIPRVALPLSTLGRWIIDSNGKRFKLASVNWYGAESKDYVVGGLDVVDLATLAKLIRTLGFNSVRLPWSNEMVELNPTIDTARLAANPALWGMAALDVLDAVIAALAHEQIVVILDNHRSHADWCCDVQHGDGLWYTDDYPEASWLQDWQGMVQRYVNVFAVVGVDLRNEPRPTLAADAPTSCTSCSAACPCVVPTWGGGDPTTDWEAAAVRGGNVVLDANPNVFVVVEGVSSALDLSGVAALPVTLNIPERVVYSTHQSFQSHAPYATYGDMQTDLESSWGFIVTPSQAYTSPVWVGEFETDHTSASNVSGATGQGFWFQSFTQYLAAGDIDWAYWPLNGTESTGYGRTLGAEDDSSVLDTTWSKAALDPLLSALQAIAPSTLGP